MSPRNQFRSPPRKQEREDIGYEGSLAGQEVNPHNQFRNQDLAGQKVNLRNQFRSPPRKQERVDTDRKSRRIGYEGSLAGQEVNPRNQFRSPPRKQDRRSLADQEVNPRNQIHERRREKT